jgi:hypothetical protein
LQVGIAPEARKIRGSCRSFTNKSSNDMALPHPQSRKDKNRNEDKPSGGGVIWNFFKRTVNIPEYRNAKDKVNRTNNRTCRDLNHHLIPFRSEFAASIFQPSTLEFWIVWVQKNEECMLFVALALMHQTQFSRQDFYPISFEILQEL